MRRQFRRPDSPLHLSHTLREPLKALSDSRFVIKSGRRCKFSLTGTLRLDHFKSQDGKSPQYKVPHWLSAMSVCLYREPGVHADVALESALRAVPGILCRNALWSCWLRRNRPATRWIVPRFIVRSTLDHQFLDHDLSVVTIPSRTNLILFYCY